MISPTCGLATFSISRRAAMSISTFSVPKLPDTHFLSLSAARALSMRSSAMSSIFCWSGSKKNPPRKRSIQTFVMMSVTSLLPLTGDSPPKMTGTPEAAK